MSSKWYACVMRDRELTDDRWAALAPHLPPQRAATGRPAKDHRLVVDAILWRLPSRLEPPVAYVFQKLVALADRLESDRSRAYNSLVFAVVARRPETATA